LNIRERYEELEKQIISKYGMLSVMSRGREKDDEPCSVRTCYQQDVDRITHSKAFRRLIHKTQVFLQPEGDHYRTRLTHTLEVSRIARTISRALGLNEDLTEAIALGHDLGHTPFGHAGERALDKLMDDCGGFKHYKQSLRVVDRIEKNGKGLNLTYEVRNGILRHTNDPLADTLEGQVVRMADRIAYINHDVDDAVRAGILTQEDIPEEITNALGTRHSVRINTITTDIIENSINKDTLAMSPGMYFVVESFHSYLFESVYKNPKAKSEERKVFGMLEAIFNYYMNNFDKLPEDYKMLAESDGKKVAVCDYVSGMTDKYAADQFGQIFIPMGWAVR